MLCTYCSKEITISRKGLCGACYARQVRNGTPETVQVNRRLGITACSFCGSDKAPFVKSLCKTCWQRNRVHGTPEPQVSKTFCGAAKCGELAVARGFCDMHYRRWMKLGSLDTKRPEGWGAKVKHPQYESWRWICRQGPNNGGVSPRWSDFWSFVDDIGDRPSDRHFLRRNTSDLPYGPGNFRWEEGLLDTPTSKSDRAAKADYMRAYNAKRPEALRKSHLKRHYGLTPEDEARMLASQNGVCAICQKPETHRYKSGKLKDLSVDHDHSTGAVRGLLCFNCNQGIGRFRDDPALLRAAAIYLERHQPKFISGMTLIATLPESLGNITGMDVRGGALVCQSESGIDYIVPASKLPSSTGEPA